MNNMLPHSKWIILFCLLLNLKYTNAQRNTVAAGGLALGSGGNASYSLGQIDYQTVTGSGGSVAQGVQHPLKITLNITALLEGFYTSSSTMNNVLFNQGVQTTVNGICDSILVELHSPNAPYTTVYSKVTTINTNGTITLSLPVNLLPNCYIALKHRNSVETWTKLPIAIIDNTTYNFTTAATQSFGDNQKEVSTGVWAFFAGDINQDELVDAFDFIDIEPDIVAGNFGYLSTDVNGDGSVDGFDYLLIEANITNGIGAVKP